MAISMSWIFLGAEAEKGLDDCWCESWRSWDGSCKKAARALLVVAREASILHTALPGVLQHVMSVCEVASQVTRMYEVKHKLVS